MHMLGSVGARDDLGKRSARCCRAKLDLKGSEGERCERQCQPQRPAGDRDEAPMEQHKSVAIGARAQVWQLLNRRRQVARLQHRWHSICTGKSLTWHKPFNTGAELCPQLVQQQKACNNEKQPLACATWTISSPAPSTVNSASVPHKNANRFSCGLQSLMGSAVTVITNTKPAKAAFAEAPARAQLPKSSSSQPWTPPQFACGLLLLCFSALSTLLHHLDCLQ